MAAKGKNGTRKRATISDVALLAGVSRQTVSNLVNRRDHLMTLETRKRVERAMKKLDYRPHPLAQGLRSGRTSTLGFLILDEHPQFLADPLTDLMLAGLGDTTRDRGYNLLIQAARPSSATSRLLDPVIERRVDAVAVLLSGDPSLRRRYIRQLASQKLPFVVFDEPVKAEHGYSIGATNEEASAGLAAHLIQHGHTRIGFVAARVPWPVVEQRHAGYRRALAEAEIAPAAELELFEGGVEARFGGEMARKLLALTNPPTAIMATSDLLAAGVLQALKQHRLSVPEDVAVTGFDDFNFSELLEPPLTTARVPAYAMGQRAAEWLIDSLDGDAPQQHELRVPIELCFRASTP
jgi:DNA-binding LacI/PurR family transcriptional regulator